MLYLGGRAINSEKIFNSQYLSSLWSTNHKKVRRVFFILSLWGGLVGASLSFIIRISLSWGHGLLNRRSLYNSVITLHALFIIFIRVIPALIGGFGNIIIPLLLGAPDISLPRVNNARMVFAGISLIFMCMRMFCGSGPGVS